MWRATVLVASLLLLAHDAAAFECPAGTVAVTGDARRVVREDVPAFVCLHCTAEWCERRGPYDMVVLNGPLRVWSSEGDLRARGSVSNDERRWRWTTFDADTGRPQFHGAWRRGRRSGHWVEWSPSGIKRYDGHYVAGERHGPWRAWDEAGRLSSDGVFDHDDEVGTWQVRDQATDQVVTESHAWPPPDTPPPCIPRRVSGGLRPPPLPTITFVNFLYRGRELHARFRLTNDHDEPACYSGDGREWPSLTIERRTRDGWESPDLSWLCAGPAIDVRVALAPGESVETVRSLGRDDRPFRAIVTVPPPAFGQRVCARTPRVDIPADVRRID